MRTPKPDNLPPPPRLHEYDKARGLKRWATYWPGGFKSFGQCPPTTGRQANQRYQHWLDTQYKLKASVRRPKGEEASFTAASLAAGYLRHAHRTYRKDGRPTSHVENVRYAMRAVRDAWADRAADATEAPDLAALRDGGLLFDEQGKARALKTVNQRLRIIKDAFVWARERRKVSASTLADVLSVKRLRKGRSAAVDPKKVKSVHADVVAAAMRFAPRVLRDMVELQELTGMRPGEVCSMRGREVEAGGDVWLYRPRHKLEHLEGESGGEKIVCLGPKAQAIVKRNLKADTGAYLFSPRDAHAQRLADRRAGRSMKLWPSHAARLRPDPVADLSDHYTTETYRRAVLYACRLAGIGPWTPNQLRHAAATRIQKKYGRDGSRVVLGHKSEATTEIYLDPDIQAAMRIAREVG